MRRNGLMARALVCVCALALTAAGVCAGEEGKVPAESAAAHAETPEKAPRAAYEAAELAPSVITVFAAKSLNSVMDELIRAYNEKQPDIGVLGSYDSSGTLMTQIREGAACDIFFSAAQKQMNELEKEGFLVEGTRCDVLNNQVCVVTYKGSGTEVEGLTTLGCASSLAIAGGSVPVGKYTREALVRAGILPEPENGDASAITTEEISAALGGVEINECANVGAVAASVSEGANEVGTVYYSDTYGYEDRLEILEIVPYELTGDVIYPAAQIRNPEADEAETAAAEDFLRFLLSEEAEGIFAGYHFDTDV